jgi:hypothetical protein
MGICQYSEKPMQWCERCMKLPISPLYADFCTLETRLDATAPGRRSGESAASALTRHGSMACRPNLKAPDSPD